MKKLTSIFLITLFIFIGVNTVKADYNGIGGSQGMGAGQCANYSKPCQWMNSTFGAVQLTLVYYDGRTWEQIGKEYYIINEEPEKKDGKITGYKGYGRTQYLIASAGANRVLTTKYLVKCGSTHPWNKGVQGKYINQKGEAVDCHYDYSWLEKYFSGTAGTAAQKRNAKIHMETFFTAIGVKPSDLDEPHDGTIGIKSVGYRILIQPVWNFDMPGNNGQMLDTIKGVLASGGTSNSGDYPAYSYLLHTEKDDIGIKAPTAKAGTDPEKDRLAIASMANGYGLNIINFDSNFLKQCYKLVVTGENPKCTNTNLQNQGNYQESFSTVDCSKTDEIVENASADGRKVKTLKDSQNKKCKVYCVESVDVRYPGNILPAIPIGGNFIWPTVGEKNIHNLDITGTRDCKTIGAACNNIKNLSKTQISEIYKNFKSSITLEFKQEKYNSNITLDAASSTISCEGCEQLSDNGTIKITRKVSLKLPDTTYRYINKKTLIAQSTRSLGEIFTHTDIGYGNLPVSNNANPKATYYLQFNNIQLGANGVFSKKAAEDKYKCSYKVKNDSDSCVCPPGTKNEGKNLECPIIKSQDSGQYYTCPDAQVLFCNGNTEYWDKCDPTDMYCPYPKQHISLKACIKAGNSYQMCKQRLCEGTEKKYECPKNTPNEYMDISPCVESLIKKGITETEAIKKCQDIVCPLNGIPIIYRTISLRNPFPSKKIDGGISGFNTDNISGRYPGANWNSKKLVEVEIRNNRGVADNEVYNKNPLYTIELNAETIREVRRYNEQQQQGNRGGYSDFTLSCSGTQGSKCRSTFLRNILGSALTGGTCRNATTATFDSCAE